MGAAHTDPFLCKLAQKIALAKVLSFFFKTTGFQLKLSILIESPNIFHWKPAKNKVHLVLGQNLGQIRCNVVTKSNETGIINRFFHILNEEYILNQQVVVVQTPEWKFKANIARNGTFEGG